MAVNPNFTNANAFTSYFSSGGGGGPVPDPLSVSTINSYTVNTTALNAKTIATSNFVPSGTPNLIPIDNYMLVNSNSQGGRVSIRTSYDANDTGAVVSCVMGSDGTLGTAFIGSEWPGYISMPMSIYGANINLKSDNETFFFLDGNAGAIGNISTGVTFNSASNVLNTITDPTKQYTADTTALFSTLKDLYPSCFL